MKKSLRLTSALTALLMTAALASNPVSAEAVSKVTIIPVPAEISENPSAASLASEGKTDDTEKTEKSKAQQLIEQLENYPDHSRYVRFNDYGFFSDFSFNFQKLKKGMTQSVKKELSEGRYASLYRKADHSIWIILTDLYDENGKCITFDIMCNTERLYYFSDIALTARTDYDFDKVTEFLAEEGTAVRVSRTVLPEAHYFVGREDTPVYQDYYTVELPEGHDTDEYFRLAALVKEKFGYVPSNRNLAQYEYSFTAPQHISADYTTPKRNEPLSDEKPDTDTDDVMYGDLNGDRSADMTDMSIISLHLIGDAKITERKMIEAADVQYDNEINLGDLAFFKQYLTKQVDSIGKYAGFTDITDKCSFFECGADLSKNIYSEKTLLISGMDEFEKYFGDSKEKDKIAESINVSEEFFRNSRLAVMLENESFNGVNYTLTSVKTDPEGNVHLYYDRFWPDVTTALGGQVHWFTVVPGNPGKGKTEVHFSDTYAVTDLRYSSTIINTRNVKVTGEYPETSGVMTSMDDYREFTGRGISPEGLTARFDINDDFFRKYMIVYCTKQETVAGAADTVSDIKLDYKNRLHMDISQYIPDDEYYGEEDDDTAENEISRWFLAAVVPLEKAERALTDSVDISVSENSGYTWGTADIGKSELFCARTDFPADPEAEGTVIVTSAAQFEKINSSHSGKYSHIKDELLSADFFRNNILVLATVNSSDANEQFCPAGIRLNGRTKIKLNAGKFVNMVNPEKGEGSEWHLAAVVSRDAIGLDADDYTAETEYVLKEALLGRYE